MSALRIAGDSKPLTASELVERAWDCAERGFFIDAALLFEDAAKVMRQRHEARMA